MKASLINDLENAIDRLEERPAPFAKKPELYKDVRDAILSSQDYEVLEQFYVFLADAYREQGNEGSTAGSNKQFCLQFLPAIVLRYLSLLVTQNSDQEMVVSLMEAFFVVICTNISRKLKKSASLPELTDGIVNENLILVPSLLKASVYMNNNEVLFPKDFISYPSTRLEFLRMRTEPSITKLDANNRQEVLAFAIRQYNCFAGDAYIKSQEDFCLMCSCIVLSGFDLRRLKFSYSVSSSEVRSHLAPKRFVLSQFLVMEMLQGLYQLSFYLSVRNCSMRALEHVSFRTRHSLTPNLIMLADSICTAVDRSCLKQNRDILAEPEVSYQERQAIVTSDSLRIAARRESIRLDKLENFGPHIHGAEAPTMRMGHNNKDNIRRLGPIDDNQRDLHQNNPTNNHFSDKQQKPSKFEYSPDLKTIEGSPNRFKIQLANENSTVSSSVMTSKHFHGRSELRTSQLQQNSIEMYSHTTTTTTGESQNFSAVNNINHGAEYSSPHNSTGGKFKKNHSSSQSSFNSRVSPKKYGANAHQKSPKHYLAAVGDNSLDSSGSVSSRYSPSVIFQMGDSGGDLLTGTDGAGNSLESSPARNRSQHFDDRVSDLELNGESKVKQLCTSFKFSVDAYDADETLKEVSANSYGRIGAGKKEAELYVDDENDYAIEGDPESKSTKRVSVPLAVVSEL
ncbi:uncharacterized protein LOC134846218 isoform X2 [Symsagittifera roscoffensis]|uniref:uncharacterized protein LOC134846218 isoform X2 n=1 Tax=Symsagittifera roscoffensis TaxID=84072 RepID=UPI00307BB2CB